MRKKKEIKIQKQKGDRLKKANKNSSCKVRQLRELKVTGKDKGRGLRRCSLQLISILKLAEVKEVDGRPFVTIQ